MTDPDQPTRSTSSALPQQGKRTPRPAGFVKPANWDELSPDQRREARFEQWLFPDIPFASEEIAQLYRVRARRFKDIVDLKKPDQVPCAPLLGGYVAEYTGVSHREFMYDYQQASQAILKFNTDFPLDYLATGNLWPGAVYDRLQCQTYQWPGGSLPPDVPFQAVEGEYMLPEEYDSFIADPEWFFFRTYLPRAFKALEGWKTSPSLINMNELVGVPGIAIPFASTGMQAAFQAMMEAGVAAKQWSEAVGRVSRQLEAGHGLARYRGGFTKAPFDIIGDTLRGTRGIMLDIYRRPGKLIAAMERIVSHAVDAGVESTSRANVPMAFIPLHKGADGFMSNANFATYYWPTFEAVLRGLIEQGLVPYLFVEGSYNQRLDLIAEAGLPPGTTLWVFDQTDMVEVKKKFGGWAAFMGNVPASLLHAGTAEQVTDHVRTLIESVGQDGGYAVSTGAVIDHAREETLRAMLDACAQHGVY